MAFQKFWLNKFSVFMSKLLKTIDFQRNCHPSRHPCQIKFKFLRLWISLNLV